MIEAGERVHIVGVAGAGMSAVARWLAGRGCQVSGCDRAPSAVLVELAGEGIDIATHHDVSHVHSADVVLWSPAVPLDHDELRAARDADVRLIARPDFLAEVADALDVVGLTGTHGKTTASSMMVCVMKAAGRDASRLVGAAVRGVGPNGAYGSDVVICEVDESYGAFARLRPAALGVLNVEADHLDHYGSLEALRRAFVEVVQRTRGPVVTWVDDPGAAWVAEASGRDVVTVGRGEGATWRVLDAVPGRRGEPTRARLRGPAPDHVEIALTLAVPGAHNVANAAVVAVLAHHLDVDVAAIEAGVAAFRGAPRRFEVLGTWRGLTVIDDYAHLPGEIAATLAAARDAGYSRLATVFQPHRYSRTAALAGEFAPAFDDAAAVVVTDIYSAGEDNPLGLDGRAVADPLATRGRAIVRYGATFEDAARALDSLVEPTSGDHPDFDALVVLGAGDVTRVLDHLDWRPSVRTLFGDDPRVAYDVALGAMTTYRVGGSVSALVTVTSLGDLDELAETLARVRRPLWLVGNGSNLVVADGHHDVVAIHLTGELASLAVTPDAEGALVVAGAGMDLPVAARRLAGEGLVGFEWAVGVPGTFGGAVAMNAGGHGSDMAAVVTRVEIWSAGRREWRDAAEMGFGYRQSALRAGEVVTRVEMRLATGDVDVARKRISEIVRWRRENQPGGANAGSVFRNPSGDSAGRLLDEAGLKGRRFASASVSTKHANFIIADAGGRADDVAELMELMRAAVLESSGVELHAEHRLLGFEGRA